MIADLESPDGGSPIASRSDELVRHAITTLVAQAHAAGPCRPPFHPLVFIAPDADTAARWLTELEQGLRSADSVSRWTAADLDAACAAEAIAPLRASITTSRLVIVPSLEPLGSPERQQAFSRLLDAAAARGTAVCVVLSAPPQGAGLDPGLESRLMAGLVVPLPRSSAAQSAAATTGLRPTCGRVIRTTAAYCDIPVAALLGAGRQRSVVQARSLAMYLSRRLTGKSLDAIGREFGGRDHSTVLRSVRAVDDRTKEDPAFAGDVQRLMVAIGGGSRRRKRRPA